MFRRLSSDDPKCPHDEDGETKIVSFEEERMIYIVGKIDYDAPLAFEISLDRVLRTARNKPHKPIGIFIHSPGGSPSAALSIYDTIRFFNKTIPIDTYVKGEAASAGLVITQAGRKRFIYPHSVIKFHSMTLKISKEEMKDWRDVPDFQKDADLLASFRREAGISNKLMFQIYHQRTKLPYKIIEKLCLKSTAFGPKEACRMGIFDGIIDIEQKKQTKT